MAKAMAKKAAGDVAEVFDFNFEADAGAGMEGADRDSFAIPFLRVLQKMSPQLDEAHAAYMPDAKAGMLYNSVTGELFDGKEGVTFLPCAYQRRFLRWAPRGSDRGFGGEMLPEEVAALRDKGQVVEKDGRLYVSEDGTVDEKKNDRLADTRSHFGLIVDKDGKTSQVLLALGSTQIKKSKQLMSMLHTSRIKNGKGELVAPPTWMNKVKITTVLEQNDQGSWHGVKFEADGFITDAELYEAGKAFHDAIGQGDVGADFAKDVADEASDTAAF